MKKIVFVSKNHILIEKITAYLNEREDMTFVLFSTTRPEMILEELDVFGASIVLIDTNSIVESDIIEMCSKICDSSKSYKSFLLINNESKEEWIIDLKQKQLITDHVSLEDDLDKVFEQFVHY